MSTNANRLTIAALLIFVLIVVCGSLGMCGKVSDHGPKPAPSTSVKAPSAPVKSSK